MGCPIARIGDSIGHGTVTLCVFTGTITGTITGTVPTPTVQSPAGIVIAKQGDAVTCSLHPSVSPNVILLGSATVKTILGASGVARVGDSTTCGAVVASGLPTVLVGP